MKKLFLIFIISCLSTTSYSQLHEIGIVVGGSNYVGDIGRETYIYPNQLMGGVLYKRNINPRFALRGTFTLAKLQANDKDANNSVRKTRGISFNNSLQELALGIEFNYWEYNLNDYKLTHTPYLLLEVAAFNYKVVDKEIGYKDYEYKSKTAFAIPFGIGYKTKIVHNFAAAFEIRGRYTFTDDIDYNNTKIETLTFGNPNSNDWYFFTGVSLVYAFGRPPCYASPY